MATTEPVDFIHKPSVSYSVAARFSSINVRVIRQIIEAAELQFRDTLFGMPADALHITVMDWISPVAGYGGRSKQELFEHLYADFDAALTKALSVVSPITVTFTEVKTSPSTIYIAGKDNGEFASLRNRFIEQVSLPAATKRPPKIIHSSLARFTKPIDLTQVESFVSKQQLSIKETFTHFDLLHSTEEPNLKFEVVKRYKLTG